MAFFNHGLFLSAFITSLAFSYGLEYKENVIYQSAEKMDFVIGGYFGVHRRGKNDICDKTILEDDIYLVEAMRYAIKKINDDPSKLFGVRLGFRVVDTCRSFRTLRNDTHSMAQSDRILGMVGPATSDEATNAAIAFGTSFLPLISYSAASIDLQDRFKYYNFFRTVPSGDIQSLALRDTLKHFNWTYISTVNSYGANGQSAMNYLIRLAKSSGICIASQNALPKEPKASDYEHIIRNLEKDKNAKTVVLITTADDTRQLFLAARSSNVTFTWLSSAAWAADFDTIRGVEKVAKGAILLNYEGINNAKFYNYFMNLTYEHNKYPWFKEFWESTFNCSLSGVEKMKRCYGNESLLNSRFYGKYAPAQAVIDAVNVYAYALRCAIYRHCPGDGHNKTLCATEKAKESLEARKALGYFIRTRPKKCPDLFGRVKFDKKGTFHRDIKILNFDGRTYKNIGVWKWNLTTKTSRLKFTNIQTSWPGKMKVPRSVCSQPCKEGERMVWNKTQHCCFKCLPCQADEIFRNKTCYKCGKYQLPDPKKATCLDLDKMPMKITNYMGIIVIAASVIGLLANSFVLCLFIKNRDSKIVKASSRELSFFMLAGLYLCFISPCVYLLQPTIVRCGLRRFLFGLSLTACYTPLMLKANRIYRIFRAALVKTSLPHLVSAKSQVIICFGLLALQLLLSIIWVAADKPVVGRVIVHEFKMVAELCSGHVFTDAINIMPSFCMLVASTIFAFKSRKFPKNYNEAYNIAITMYVSCVLWAILTPLLLVIEIQATDPLVKNFVKANFMNIIGIVSLGGMLGPKVRRLVCCRASKKSIGTQNNLARSIEMSYYTSGKEEKSEPSGEVLITKISRVKSILRWQSN